MKIRLVDPIHVFDAKGRSILEVELLRKQLAMVTRQRDRLLRVLRAQKAHADTPETEKPIVH